MKKGEYRVASARCPFYICETTHGVKCVGRTAGMTVKTCFSAASAKREYCIRYCRADYEKCELFELAKKGEGNDENI